MTSWQLIGSGPASGTSSHLGSPHQALQEHSGLVCGFESDCPLSYSLAFVNASVLDVQAEAAMRQRRSRQHARARADCMLHNFSEGGCLGSMPRRLVQLSDGSSYHLPDKQAPASSALVSALLEEVIKPGESVVDLGAGAGQYGHALRARRPLMRYSGFDGAGDVEEYTSRFVTFADLTVPAALPRADWAISIGLGEHIPHEKEQMFIRNVHRANCRGVVIAWASLKQNGSGHVNCHSTEYLVRLFGSLGYVHNTTLQRKLRDRTKHETEQSWITRDVVAFHRRTIPAGCPVGKTGRLLA